MIENHSSCSKVSDTKICPSCYSSEIIKNGTTKTKKQQYFCKNCKRRFLDFYTYHAYLPQINSQIILLTKEGLGIRSTARVLKISITTLLKRITTIAKEIKTPTLSYGQTYEMDEIRFFIRSKKNLNWLVYAIDKKSKQVASFFIGKRTNKTLKAVTKTLENADAKTIYTDGLINYQFIIPQDIHKVKRYATNTIERKNLNIRTHLKRFNRKTICFSKNLIILKAILKIYFWG